MSTSFLHTKIYIFVFLPSLHFQVKFNSLIFCIVLIYVFCLEKEIQRREINPDSSSGSRYISASTISTWIALIWIGVSVLDPVLFTRKECQILNRTLYSFCIFLRDRKERLTDSGLT
jgi:hypothetical protein